MGDNRLLSLSKQPIVRPSPVTSIRAEIGRGAVDEGQPGANRHDAPFERRVDGVDRCLGCDVGLHLVGHDQACVQLIRAASHRRIGLVASRGEDAVSIAASEHEVVGDDAVRLCWVNRNIDVCL
jgi:hypothetical protein